MKLLIVTQKADKTDPVLGFAHSWIEEFAKHAEHVHVVAQYVGEHALPPNVTVHSLGKEKGIPTWRQVLRFQSLIWSLRNDYDAVLVHMTPVWMVIGGPVWMLLGKGRYLWYESRGTKWSLKVALMMVKKVFSASSYGMPLRSRKSVITGHGIDTDLFRPDPSRRVPGRILSVGRVTAGKHPDRVLRLLAELPESCHLLWIGKPVTDADRMLAQSLQRDMDVLRLRTRASFTTVPHEQLPALLQEADLFVHASQTGLDKALLEAMSAGCLVLSTSPALAGVLPEQCLCDAADLVPAATKLLALSDPDRSALQQGLRRIVEQEHGLSRLIALLFDTMSRP